MSKKPPNRPGITFEVGARVEAQDYLQKWYPSRIEKIDYDEGKMLVHFDRWSHRYDEWILWDSSRLRPLERPALRKEGLKEEEVSERLSEMRASRLRELPGSTESTEDQKDLPQQTQSLGVAIQEPKRTRRLHLPRLRGRKKGVQALGLAGCFDDHGHLMSLLLLGTYIHLFLLVLLRGFSRLFYLLLLEYLLHLCCRLLLGALKHRSFLLRLSCLLLWQKFQLLTAIAPLYLRV